MEGSEVCWAIERTNSLFTVTAASPFLFIRKIVSCVRSRSFTSRELFIFTFLSPIAVMNSSVIKKAPLPAVLVLVLVPPLVPPLLVLKLLNDLALELGSSITVVA